MKISLHTIILINDASTGKMQDSSIVIGGVSALYLSDWTDRVPSNMEFLVKQDPAALHALGDLPESRFFEREPDYFDQFIRPNCHCLGGNPIPVLSPAWALADAWRSGEWRPGPDDLECDDIIESGALADISTAFNAMGIKLPPYLSGRGRRPRGAQR